MIPKPSPESSGAVRARLAYLQKRKIALDMVIDGLERYSAVVPIPANEFPKARRVILQPRRRLAGAA